MTNFNRILFWGLMLAVCGVVGLCVCRMNAETNDGIEYKNVAHNLLENNFLYAGNLNEDVDFRLFSKRTPGYPLFLIFQWQQTWLIGLVSGIMWLFCYFLGLSTLQQLTSRRISFITYTLLFLLHIPLLIHVSFAMADLLLTCLVSLAVLIGFQRKIEPGSKLLLLVFLWGLGVFTKPVLLPSLILSPLLLLYFRRKHKCWRWALLAPFCIWVIISSINYQNTEQFEYSSISTINLGQYNTKLLISNVYGFDSAQRFVAGPAFVVPRSKASYARYKRSVRHLSFETCLKHLKSYCKIHFLGTIKMMLDPGRFELFTISGESNNQISLTELIYAQNWKVLIKEFRSKPLLLLVMIGLLVVSLIKAFLFLCSVKSWYKNPLMILTLFYFVGIAGPVGAARFLLPASVIYLVFCSLGWVKLLDFFQKSSKS